MGRPYIRELQQLHTTYDWALDVDIDRLATAIRDLARFPLTAVGSGGSLTVAEFAVHLHDRHSGLLNRAFTPLSAVHSPINLRQCGVFMATASGRNSDLLGSYTRLAAREPRHLVILCLAKDSPVARLAAQHTIANVIDMAPPVARDGFLATNSLLASVVLLLRAYAEVFAVPTGLPRPWAALLPPETQRNLETELTSVWAKQTHIVLHGASSRIAALDLESKFSEAALGNLRTSDYRDFAHGRHYWLAKRGDSTAVLALVAPEDHTLADRTLSLISEAVHVVREDIPFPGSVGEIAALARAMYIVGLSAQALGVDPGRPTVPSFGRRLYHLRAFRTTNRRSDSPATELLAIGRKTGLTPDQLQTHVRLPDWRAAYRRFQRRLADARFIGVVFDYDGTLCGPEDRSEALRLDVALELSRLLDAGVVIGVASGRGKSVRAALRMAIPEPYWDRVFVGYYNGACIFRLSDSQLPDATEPLDGAFASLADQIHANQPFLPPSTIDVRHPQLTVAAAHAHAHENHELWLALQELLQRRPTLDTSLVRSGHSVDILAPGVDKRTILTHLTAAASTEGPILCIGDSGAYPGNDHRLLTEPWSLSVDEVSRDPNSCWNLAPEGTRWADACLAYMRRLSVSSSIATFV